ncbi:MAG: glycosyltransferase family 4 protein [Actinomycetota bacterium]|nr:glycosyltransferase family 4 protein [Actinomycetota bacterium]
MYLIHGLVDGDDIPRLYEWADAFLHPQIDLNEGSDFEGFGLSIADAMWFGCPAIAGRGAGPSDFVLDGVTCSLVDGSDPEELQSKIQTVLEDQKLTRELAAAGPALRTECTILGQAHSSYIDYVTYSLSSPMGFNYLKGRMNRCSAT